MKKRGGKKITFDQCGADLFPSKRRNPLTLLRCWMAVFLDKCFFMIRDVFQVLTTQFLVVCVCVCLSLDLQSICYSVNRNSLQRVDYTRRRERIIVILFFSSEAPCCCCCTRWISSSFSFIFFRNRTTYSCFILVDATVVRISGTTQLFLFSFT